MFPRARVYSNVSYTRRRSCPHKGRPERVRKSVYNQFNPPPPFRNKGCVGDGLRRIPLGLGSAFTNKLSQKSAVAVTSSVRRYLWFFQRMSRRQEVVALRSPLLQAMLLHCKPLYFTVLYFCSLVFLLNAHLSISFLSL